MLIHQFDLLYYGLSRGLVPLPTRCTLLYHQASLMMNDTVLGGVPQAGAVNDVP